MSLSSILFGAIFNFTGIIIMVLTLIVYAVIRIKTIKKEYRKRGWLEELTNLLFTIYLSMVVSVTLFPISIRFSHDETLSHSINLIPLITIVRDFKYIGTGYGGDPLFMIEWIVKNVGGNILLLMPLGFLLPIVSGNYKKFNTIFFIGLITSISIEFLQFWEILFGLAVARAVDIDDVICNVLGASLGYVLYQFIVSWYGKLNPSSKRIETLKR